MTDSMSGRARLSRNNINILGATPEPTRLIYEFQYRLPTGQTVWRKTMSEPLAHPGSWTDQVLDEVRVLRRELEKGHEN